ncbi:MAG: succinylglutamate desuccinylase/aspartoacylase family protein [Rhodoferax sp.]|nr:succinylglutamate desuccinylase/aspartoacylase family protein [Rhodoferax sp.]
MPAKINTIALPSMTPGSHRQVQWLRFGKAGARPKVYLQAAIHANEMPGTMALHHLMPQLLAAEEQGLIDGEIIVVPTVNPIGQAQLVGNSHAGRYNLLSYENFNRNWLALSDTVAERVGASLGSDADTNVKRIRKAARQALSEMQPVNELQTLRVEVMKLSIDADYVLDLHCDIHAALHLFTSQCDWANGAIRELAADLGAKASLCNEPFATSLTFSGVHSSLWGRLRERYSQAAIPQACMSVTVEMRSQFDVSDALGASDAKNLMRWLVRRGVIKGRAQRLPPLLSPPMPMSGMDVGYSQGTGFLVFHEKPGALVKKGQAICDVIDPANPHGPQARTSYLSQTDGVLFSCRLDGYLSWPGQVMYRIAGSEPLPHRLGASGLDD